jgi:predicted  nucleic acid-binding Zn-ribbon protein
MVIWQSSSWRKSFIWIGAMVLGLVLSACISFGSAEMEVTVYSGARHTFKAVISLPPEDMNRLGGTGKWEELLDELVAEARVEGAVVRWRRLGSTPNGVLRYEVSSPMAKITDDVWWGLTLQEVSYDNRKAYRIQFNDLVDVGRQLRSFSITLNAGEILESNGQEVDAQTVRWTNPRQRPYAIVIPKASLGWIPLLGAGVLALSTGGTVGVLGVTGRLKTWGSAGFSTGKWRIQAMKLGKQLSRLQKDKAKLVAELGAKAWEARLAHPSYLEPYTELQDLERQRIAVRDETRPVESELQQVRQTRSEVDDRHTARINELQKARRNSAAQLAQIRSDRAALEKRLRKAESDQQQTQTELQTFQDRLAQIQTTAAPDWETQAASLEDAMGALELSLTSLASAIPDMHSEIAHLNDEQEPLAREIGNLEQQISQAQTEQREALAPLDRQIAGLLEQIRAKSERQTALAQQMTPLISELGPLVDRARPESAALSETYARLDKAYHDMADVSQQHNLLTARLGAVDTGTVTRFYLLVGGVLLALILIAVLLAIGF